MSTKRSTEADRKIGTKVQLRRLMLGLSQKKLAERLGLTFQQIQKYEKGSNRIGAGRLQEIAHVLDMPIGYFYEEEAQEADVASVLCTPDGVRLLKAFDRLAEGELRRCTVEIVEAIAASQAQFDPNRREPE